MKIPRRDWREDRRVVRLLLLGTGNTIQDPSTFLDALHNISWKVYAGYSSPIFLVRYFMSEYVLDVRLQLYNLKTLPPNNLTTLQPYNLTNLQPYNLTTIQPCNLTTIQSYNLTTLQPYKRQKDKNTDRQKYKMTKRQKDILAQVRVFIWHWRWVLNQIFIYFVATLVEPAWLWDFLRYEVEKRLRAVWATSYSYLSIAQ